MEGGNGVYWQLVCLRLGHDSTFEEESSEGDVQVSAGLVSRNVSDMGQGSLTLSEGHRFWFKFCIKGSSFGLPLIASFKWLS